ncbi:cyclopropane-fatty-acyl-phospholipid synthase family protein [Methylocapsa sp. S129]|uniref:SAM-dependent methyltransferase n=1 Tax=Methylocapsa sp. S129 TaxID=1641869 RepID=UPI00131B5C80|nr:cyclopropane-fatty-acyl-phospholipid synthase family protein [Methylocapsa sp. S129]
MASPPGPTDAEAGVKTRSSQKLAGFAGFALGKVLSLIDVGRLVIELPSGAKLERIGAHPGPQAEVKLNNWRALRRLVLGGDVGVATAYFDNDWSSVDLTALFELAALNGARFMDALEGSAPFRVFNWLAHRAKANTRRGSRRNIEAHYDLGNEFYRLWLDAKMIYSSAIFGSANATLEQAQDAKLQRIVDRLQLAGGDSVLEIGCGWGGLATTIAQNSAARVTGVTISPAQLDSARALIQEKSLEDRVELRLQDYRDIEGRFDRIVSVEMVEAVGREYMPRYFDMIRERLKPGGLCVLQAITIAEDRFADYCRRPDFIQRYIFPGGFLPSKTFLRETIERAGLRLTAVENFGESYALTLREWRRRFLDAWPEIERLGFGPSFKRLWEYYLCYCEAGFRSGTIDVGIYSLAHASGAKRLAPP